jgi:hypothetical protein
MRGGFFLIALALCLTPCFLSAQTTYNYYTLDYPSAAGTLPNDLNQAGMIVGSYLDGSNTSHGFSFNRGSFTAINAPGATFTIAKGINREGVIVGSFGTSTSSSSSTHGFILRHGSFTQVDVPDASNTWVTGINDSGTISGYYIGSSGSTQGFVQAPSQAIVTEDFPGSTETAVNAINNRGDLTGQTSPPFISAFLYTNSDDQWTDFYYPGAMTTTGDGINNSGEVVGIWNPSNPSPPSEGFLRGADGINDAGAIVGNYNDSAGVIHGFVALPQMR